MKKIHIHKWGERELKKVTVSLFPYSCTWVGIKKCKICGKEKYIK